MLIRIQVFAINNKILRPVFIIIIIIITIIFTMNIFHDVSVYVLLQKTAFQDANVCLFVFDCLHYNGENLMTK